MKLIASRRKLDALGRLVLPEEGRHALGLDIKAPIDVLLDEDNKTILLRRSVPSCICCGSEEELRTLPYQKHLCSSCFYCAEMDV